MRNPNFELRTESEVLKINLHPDGKTAKSVTYIDDAGTECEQPADIILLCGYGLMNVRMMFLSGIGAPYDPKTGKGVVGRNYCYQTGGGGAQLIFDDKKFNPFVGAGALSTSAHDFNADAFDHSNLDFVGGATIGSGESNGRPITNRPTPPGTPRWGSKWKEATAKTYGRVMGIGGSGSSYPIRGNYLDLDPTYTDRHGRPLLRITFDFPDNDIRMQQWVSKQCEKIARTLNPKILTVGSVRKDWNSVPYGTTHNTGGAVMGGRSDHQRGEQISAELGCFQCVCGRRFGLPAERRPESHRHRGRAGLLGSGGDPRPLYEGAGTVDVDGATGRRAAAGFGSKKGIGSRVTP